MSLTQRLHPLTKLGWMLALVALAFLLAAAGTWSIVTALGLLAWWEGVGRQFLWGMGVFGWALAISVAVLAVVEPGSSEVASWTWGPLRWGPEQATWFLTMLGRMLGRTTKGIDPSTLARDAGLVFHEPADQLFHRTVEAEARYGGLMRGWSEDEVHAATDRALRATGLDVIRNANPRDLPHSHRRLLCLSCMLAAAPGVLILDEPTAGMDSSERSLVSRLLHAWATAGGGVLAITHDKHWTATTCTRVLRMDGGRLLEPEASK